MATPSIRNRTSPGAPLKLGDIMVRQGLLTNQQRDEVLKQQRILGRPFGELAERIFHVSPAAVEQAWAEQCSMVAQTIDPRKVRAETDALSTITKRQAWQFRVLPLYFEHGELVFCTTKHYLPRALRFVAWRVSPISSFVLSGARELGEALMKHFPMDGMDPSVVSDGGLLGVSAAGEIEID